MSESKEQVLSDGLNEVVEFLFGKKRTIEETYGFLSRSDVRSSFKQILEKVFDRGRREVNEKQEEALQHIMRPSFLARYEGKERKGISEAVEHLRAIRTEAKQ